MKTYRPQREKLSVSKATSPSSVTSVSTVSACWLSSFRWETVISSLDSLVSITGLWMMTDTF